MSWIQGTALGIHYSRTDRLLRAEIDLDALTIRGFELVRVCLRELAELTDQRPDRVRMGRQLLDEILAQLTRADLGPEPGTLKMSGKELVERMLGMPVEFWDAHSGPITFEVRLGELRP